jgi:hypothetical protein
MPPRKPRPSADRARLKVLAAADDAAFLAFALDLLASGQRLDREAALEALAERPLAGARDVLRALYFDLDADGLKRDQGALQRGAIVQILRAIADVRDAEIAVRAADTREVAFGEDITWRLRVQGLIMLAELAPALFPYYAIEHLDDVTLTETEPAGTAFQLLAATENFAPIYGWLRSPSRPESPQLVARVFELFAAAPAPIVRGFVEHEAASAIRRQDEALCTVLAEAIVNLELEASYPTLATLFGAKISGELYAYLAMLLAATNRPPLLSILEEQLHGGRRPKLIAEALRLRPTPEQQAFLDRWERDGD